MLRRDLSGASPRSAHSLRGLRSGGRLRTGGLVVGAAVILAGGTAAGLAAAHSGTRHGSPSGAHLTSPACGGPAGAAYVSDAGGDGFTAIDTATCDIIQTYNVGDRQVPGDPGDQDFDSTNEGVDIHGSTLYFADAGNSTVAVINTKKLNPKNFNPAEKLINVGLFPESVAVTPDGKQVWSADTGPQSSPASPSGVSVISTGSDKVVAKLPLSGTPSSVAFSPSERRTYVATSAGLWIYRTQTRQVLRVIRGLGEPRSVAVSPDGQTVYVTATDAGAVAVINAATDTVTRTIKVGELPWQVIVSADGKTVYVANPDSDSVSVIDAATGTVSHTISVSGDPETLALTPNGQRLWVGQNSAGTVSVLNTATNAFVGDISLGGERAQSGDGFDPAGIILVATPTPGS
jgi:YVTN family beta-propeller protein